MKKHYTADELDVTAYHLEIMTKVLLCALYFVLIVAVIKFLII